MKSFKQLGLKRQFTIFVIAAIVFTLLLHGCILFYVIGRNEQRSQQYVDSIAGNIANTITVIASNLERAGYAFSLNHTVSALYSGRSKTKVQEDTIGPIYEMVRFIMDYNPDLLDVAVVEPSGRSSSFFAGINEPLLEELKKYYDFSNIQNTERVFMFFPSDSHLVSEYYVYLVPVYDIYNLYDNNKKLATAVFINKVSTLRKLVSSIDAKAAFMDIYDADHRLLASNLPRVNPDLAAGKIPMGGGNKRVEKSVPAMGLKLVGMLNSPVSDENISFLKDYFVISLSALLMILIATVLFVQHTVTNPILRLNREMEQIAEHSRNRRVEMGDSLDINSIAAKINQMLDKVDTTNRMIFDTQNRLYETEIRKNEAEIYALQSQINPHFLYNTLQCVRGLAVYHNVEEIAAISTAMSELFRYSIKGKEYVTLSEEMNIADLYMTITNIRFSGRYHYEIHVDPQILQAKTIKMILQPLAENAVLHGLADVEEDGCLRIYGMLSDNLIWLKVVDNGTGISPDDLQYITGVLNSDFHDSISVNSKCMGLYNINRRIKLHFGPEYGISISSGSKGTEVSVTFPFIDNQIQK